MTTERLRAELLLILSPVRERRIWRCLSRDDNERKAGPLFLARQRSFAENRTKPGWRSSDRNPASAFAKTADDADVASWETADLLEEKSHRENLAKMRTLPSRLQSAIHNLKSTIHRGHSSVGRAPALQAGSQGFESPCLQFYPFSICDLRLSI